ncbi:TPA: hypothetical protein P0P67_002618 [Staphylococcus aureus]|nr:hypothetical protein [Staphylococcus aureus]
MSNLNELNLDSITNAKGVKIPFVIAFTYSDEYLELFTKTAKAWKQFEKTYSTDRPKEDYYKIDDIKIDSDDENEPFKDKPTALITKESLSAITERDKQAINFGIRVVDEDNKLARIFDDEMVKYFNIGDINENIEFDDIEAKLNEVKEQTKTLNDANIQQQEIQENKDSHNVYKDENNEAAKEAQNEDVGFTSFEEKQDETKEVSNQDETEKSDESNNKSDATETTQQQPDSDNTDDTPNKPKSESTDDKPLQTQNEQHENVTQNHTPITEIPTYTDEENAAITQQNKAHAISFEPKTPETPLEFAQQDLMYEITKAIPEIELPSLNYIPDDIVDNMSESKSYDRFLTIKKLTEDKLTKRAENTQKHLSTIRQDAVLKIYNKLNRRLNIENDELLRKSDFSSEYSPFYEGYAALNQEHKKIIDSLSDTKNSEVQKNTQQHEANKKDYVERAAKQAEREYDQNNLHLIEDKAQAYIDDIKSTADKEYKSNYETLEKDSNNWYVTNFNTLVPKIVQASKDEIEQIGNNITQATQDSVKELNVKMEADLDYFVNNIRAITEKEIETDENNEALINSKVHERTIQYSDMKNTIANLEEEKERLKKEISEAYDKAENNRRDYISEKKRNEALETTLSNRNLDVNAARDDYHNLQRLIADGNTEKLQRMLDKIKGKPVTQTFFDKVKQLSNLIAAGIIAISIIISSLIFGLGGHDDNANQNSQSAVQSQVDKAIKDNDKKHADEQKQQQKEIDSLKDELKKANDSKDKKEK